VNGDVVRRAFTIWNEQPLVSEEAFAEFARPDMVVDVTQNTFNPATYEGFEGFQRFVDQIGEAWAEFRMEPQEVFERGDLVVVLVRAVGTGRESGVKIDSPVAVVCEMREGKIAVLRVEPDREAALAQVGR
jgi:ketosteroid isomerase-like protein